MKISFHTLGDEALLINFEQKIDQVINEQVHSLARTIERANYSFVRYITPAYCSILIAFDKTQISFNSLKTRIEELTLDFTNLPGHKPRKLYVPVCYDRSFALDLEEITKQTNLSASEIIEKHTSILFQVYMIGFLPGFPYLGKLPNELECTRKANPRLEVPKGAIGLAGLQTGIYPKSSPGGWQIIGNTPINLMGANKNDPFLFQAGDEVQFYSISKSKHQLIIEEQKKGTFNWANVYEEAH